MEIKPRINGALMNRYKGQRVLLVGMPQDMLADNLLTLKTSDDFTVQVILNQSGMMTNTVEFDGVVEADGKSLREISRASFGDDLDVGTYDHTVELINDQYRGLFYG